MSAFRCRSIYRLLSRPEVGPIPTQRSFATTGFRGIQAHPRPSLRLVWTTIIFGSLACATSSVPRSPLLCEASSSTIEDLQKEWDEFYARSVKPGDDDDDDDDDDEEEEEDGEVEEDEHVAVNDDTDIQNFNENEDGLQEQEGNYLGVQADPLFSSEPIEKAKEGVSDERLAQPNRDGTQPDTDEPTSCSICRINRQGPCRSLWRKFELCMKQNMGVDSSTGDAPAGAIYAKCDEFMMPWISCFQEHRNFYTLVTNAFYKNEFIDDTEAAIPEDKKRVFKEVEIDWTEYLSFVKENDMSPYDWLVARRAADTPPKEIEALKDSITRLGVEYKQEVLHFANDNDPKGLCDCIVQVPLKDSEFHYPIEVAYARDQNGNVLGFDMFFTTKKERSKEYGTLHFSVQFGATHEVTLFAIYQNEDENVDKVDKILYCSKPITVLTPMKEAGLFDGFEIPNTFLDNRFRE